MNSVLKNWIEIYVLKKFRIKKIMIKKEAVKDHEKFINFLVFQGLFGQKKEFEATPISILGKKSIIYDNKCSLIKKKF